MASRALINGWPLAPGIAGAAEAAPPIIVPVTISGTPGAAVVGDNPTFTPAISGGTAPYTLSLASGTLPPGRTVNGSAKNVTGAYTTAGNYAYVLRATDALGATADLSVSIVVSAATAAAFYYGMPMTDSGDSITALKDNSGHLPWLEFFTYGFFALRTGADQAISGSEINEAYDSHDILRADRRSYFTSQLGPGIAALLAIGTNSMDTADTQLKAGLDMAWGDATNAGSPIIAATILPSASNQSTSVTTGLGTSPKQRYDSVNAYIRSKASSSFLIYDGALAWGETYVGKTDSGNLHPNTPGAIDYGLAGRKMLTDANIPLGIGYGFDANPSDNIVSGWDMSGTTGGKSGTSTINGNVPTGYTVAASISGLVIDVSVVNISLPFLVNGAVQMKSVPVLQLDLSGTAAAQGTGSILQSANISPTEQAGAVFETMHYLSASGISGGAPSGLNLGSQTNSGSLSVWSGANTASIAGVIDRAIEGVARGRSQMASAAVGTNGILAQFRVAAGTVNIRLRYGLGYFRRSERTAYSAPGVVHTARDDLSGPLVGPSITGTAANGNTLTGRPGFGWKGGNYNMSYQWQRTSDGGTTVEAISGATAITYAVSGQSGYQIRIMVTMGANGIGPAVSTPSAWTTAVA